MSRFTVRRTLLAVLAATAACASLPAFASKDKPVVGFSIDDLRVERWARDRDYFIAAAKELRLQRLAHYGIREAIKARAAQDAHEHSLRLVIGMVRRREHIGPAALQRLPEKCVAQLARRKLYRLALRLRESRHIAVPDKARHFALAAEYIDEAGILCG